MEKPTISKHVFTVKSVRRVTPHYIRVKLACTEPTDFEKCTPGANNKIFIPPAGQDKVQFSVYDEAKGEWVMPGEDVKPVVRTYTHRALDPETGEISIDFVDHGDGGPASSWARAAKPGDELGIAMKIRPTVHYPADTQWLLLVADATGIPVVCSILEGLPHGVSGECVIEVASEQDIHPELTHPNFEVRWLINEHPDQLSPLPEVVAAVTIPEGKKTFSYVACEYSAVKAIRTYFKESLGWGAGEYYAFSYWKAGVAEDKSAGERREEKHSG